MEKAHEDSSKPTWGALISKNDRIKDQTLYLDSTTIGRKDANDIVVKDKRLSSTHCKITRSGPFFTLIDLSTNGTYLNGSKVGEDNCSALNDGDEIALLKYPKVPPEEAIIFRFSVSEGTGHSLKREATDEISNVSKREPSTPRCFQCRRRLDPCSSSSLCELCELGGIPENNVNESENEIPSHPNEEEKKVENVLPSLETEIKHYNSDEEEKSPRIQSEEIILNQENSPAQKKKKKMVKARKAPCSYCGKKKAKFSSSSKDTIKCAYCAKPACDDCIQESVIAEVKARTPPDLPPNLFGGNQIEQQILYDFLVQNGTSNKDILIQMADKKEPYLNRVLEPTDQICGECMEIIWPEMLFRYRIEITPMLPPEIRDREDCWYGKECRTQFHKLDHAKRLNHICENTHKGR